MQAYRMWGGRWSSIPFRIIAVTPVVLAATISAFGQDKQSSRPSTDSASGRAYAPIITADDVEIFSSPDRVDFHANGRDYVPQEPAVATPLGTTYSVSHQLYGDPDGTGPLGPRCIFIFNPTLPGAQDDIVRFDEVPEITRQDFFGTAPTVFENAIANPGGTFTIIVRTASTTGADLFPGGLTNSQGQPFTDVCFTVGLDDALEWEGLDVVLAGVLEMRNDGNLVVGPINLPLQSFTQPWDGFVSIRVPNAAGLQVDQVQLQLFINKTVDVPGNDQCAQAASLGTGSFPFSNVGSLTTDGPDEPEACDFNGYTQIGSDIWFEHEVTCTGDLTVDTCSSFFDTKVAVYDDCDNCPPASPPRACVDDTPTCGPFGNQARAVVPVEQGECLKIRVGGYQGDQGPGTLKLSCAPGACCQPGACTDGLIRHECDALQGTWIPGNTCATVTCPAAPPVNDLCEDSLPLTRGVAVTATSNGAGGGNASSCGGDNDSADVWYHWTADCSGFAIFDLCDSNIDTTLAIYDQCEGEELACNDDTCGNRSRIQLLVQQGRSYRIRVAGFNGAAGTYTLKVTGCGEPTVACCLNAGFCLPGTPTACAGAGGRSLPTGSACLGDQNGNFIDDACEICPAAAILSADPSHGTVDARRMFSPTQPTPLEGLGTEDEPIVITLIPPVTDAEDCFDLCESAFTSPGPNDIASVTPLGDGQYEIVLERAITPAAVTTINYLGGTGGFVMYRSHPSNVDGGPMADAGDVTALIDCCLLGLCSPAHGVYSCDLDRSGAFGPLDLITLIDLLNGGGEFFANNNTALPQPGPCP